MIGGVQQKTGDRLRPHEVVNAFGASSTPVSEALRRVDEGASWFSGFRWAAEDLDGIPAERLRGRPGEIEPAETRIDDLHRRVQLVGDFFSTFFEDKAKQHLPGMPRRDWGLFLQDHRYSLSVPQVVPERLESCRDFYRAFAKREIQGEWWGRSLLPTILADRGLLYSWEHKKQRSRN